MPIHIICPGCLKRFQVNVRFAGLQGPCPNCRTIISIPAESVKIHGQEDTLPLDSRPAHLTPQPLPRLDWNIGEQQAGRWVAAAAGVLVTALIFGWLPIPREFREIIGVTGLCLTAFPLTLLGYQIFRDKDLIFALTGTELRRRAAITAAGYVIFWIGFEYVLAAMQADMFMSGIYAAVFAMLAASLAHPFLVLKFSDAFLHYSLFALIVSLLRFCLGLGWFWNTGDLIRYTAAPPAPLVPGM